VNKNDKITKFQWIVLIIGSIIAGFIFFVGAVLIFSGGADFKTLIYSGFAGFAIFIILSLLFPKKMVKVLFVVTLFQ